MSFFSKDSSEKYADCFGVGHYDNGDWSIETLPGCENIYNSQNEKIGESYDIGDSHIYHESNGDNYSGWDTPFGESFSDGSGSYTDIFGVEHKY